MQLFSSYLQVFGIYLFHHHLTSSPSLLLPSHTFLTVYFGIYTLYSSPLTLALGFSVFTSRTLATYFITVSLSFQITHDLFFAPPNSFLAIILQLPIPKTRLNSSQMNSSYSLCTDHAENTASLLLGRRVHSAVA
jgi:hypothetical protein